MKANGKYTIAELLTEAGVKTPEKVVSKMRVRVGGVPVNKIDTVLTVPAGTTKLDVIVGIDKFEITVDGDNEDRVISEGAQAVLTIQGKETTKQVEEIQKAKAEAQAKVKKVK